MTKKLKYSIILLVLIAFGILGISADHIDAPAVQGGSSDVTDFYVFQGEDSENLVFVANLKGLLSPEATATATFDESVLIEFNIDNDNDFIEDLVIQAIPRDGRMYVFGPSAPMQTGINSTILENTIVQAAVDITPYGEAARIGSESGITVFAGPRDDPFFMDFAQYGQIISGNATSFNNPGADTFAGTNVLSIVVEVPKSLIGNGGTINTWVESKQKL